MNLRAVLLATTAAFVGAVGTAVLAPAPADAAATGDVIGAWTLRLKMEGWHATAADVAGEVPHYDPSRGIATAVLRIQPRDPLVNDGLVIVEITLDPASSGSVLALATPGSPNVKAVTAFVGDSITAIDSGTPNYVNAVNLRFDRQRRKVSGTWFAAFPPSEARLDSQKFAAAVSANVSGKRARRLDPRLEPRIDARTGTLGR